MGPRLCEPKKYKCGGYNLFAMFNKHTTALYAIVISSLVVASVFAISLYNNKHQHRVTRPVEAVVVVVTRLVATQLAAVQQPAAAQLVLVAVIVINQIGGNTTS